MKPNLPALVAPVLRTPARALWSVHDVSPNSFPRVREIVQRLTDAGRGPLTVLVVPVGEWQRDDLAQLAAWQAEGHLLALHGWDHRAPARSGLYHRLHSLVISRDAAEHLGRGRAQIAERVSRGRDWFVAQHLGPPRMYVPPAWAMGELPVRWFAGRGFDWVETQTGIYQVGEGQWWRLPVIGFEARGRFQAALLRVSNALNMALSRLARRPLRIAIHPEDFELHLATYLERLIEAPGLTPLLPGEG